MHDDQRRVARLGKLGVRATQGRYERTGRAFSAGVLLAGVTLTGIALAVGWSGWAWAEDAAGEVASSAAAAEARLLGDVGYLASDDLGGRGVGTEGINAAADYVAQRFAELGLNTTVCDGGPFQEFTMTIGASLGATNQLELVGPAGEDGQPRVVKLESGKDFTPLAMSGSGVVDLPVVFAGYGISASDLQYDDYAGVDVKGKAVLVLRHEPQQDNPHSVFEGEKHSQYAPFLRKLATAYEQGVGAVVFCTDAHEIEEKVAGRAKRWQEALEALASDVREFSEGEKKHDAAAVRAFQAKVDERLKMIGEQGEKLRAEYDPLLDFEAGGDATEARTFPVLHSCRGPWEQVVQEVLGKSLAELETAIDEGPTPRSGELSGWRLRGQVQVERKEARVKNVVGVLEGRGALAEQTIVIGAHYDHLGMGGAGSLAPGATEIHNGADDNGSGTAALLEVARRLAQPSDKPRRRLVFIAFTGEERGLIGSAHYVRQPIVPLEQTVAMLNMDMVGRLTDDKLVVYGTGTAVEFDGLLDELNERMGFKITRQPGGFGPSDHSSFYAKRISVLHFFTGTHTDYHRPSDDVDKLNVVGMRRVVELVTEMATRLAEGEQPPLFVQTKNESSLGGDGKRPYFGSVPDFSQSEPGYGLMSVTKDSPAERAGLKGGDVIVKLGESPISGLEDFDTVLRKYKAGDKVPVTIRRSGAEQVVEVTLDPPR